MAVNVCQPHPLFAGLPAQPIVYQAHYWEVKDVPTGFQVLAESELCPVQAMAHQERPIFSTQFHPEEYDTDHPNGRKILQNFFQLTINN
jgi:GMP synthase (glutamine-hydrolysing)